MKSSLRKVSGIVLVLAVLMLFGCATTQNQNIGYMPGQQSQPIMNSYGSQGNQSPDRNFVGVVLAKRIENLQTVLYLGSDVATLAGVEVYDTFKQCGWSQVTHADAHNQTEIDILCRLGASGERISAQCLSDSRVAPAQSTGTIEFSGANIARVGGIDRARSAIVALLNRQHSNTVSKAVEDHKLGQRR